MGMIGSRHTLPSWVSAATASRVEFDGNVSSMSEVMFKEARDTSPPQPCQSNTLSNVNLGFGERAISATGAAFLSAILVNPLDVAKTRLQAQAAGVPYSNAQHHVGGHTASLQLNTYKGTLDVFYKIIRQEGFARLWRGTNAGLALAVPTVGIYLPCYDLFHYWIEEFTTQNAPNLTPYVPLVAGSASRSLACISCYPIELARTRMQAFKEMRIGVKLPGVWKTLLGVLPPVSGSNNNFQNLQSYRIFWMGVGAQLARDVPFSAICWSILEPIRRRILGLVGEEANVESVLGANFSAGFFAGSLAAAATCPLDVVKTRRQIEKDPIRSLRMTTRKTLMNVWRDGGAKGLFMGIGPRVGRAGPSVGIIVSFYEVAKHILHHRTSNS